MTAGQSGRFDYDAELRRYHRRLQAAVAVGPRDQVLDIGCGTGLLTRASARAAVDGSALGVDLSAQMIATARRLGEQEGLRNVHFEQGDAQVHPWPAERFSLAVSRFGTMFFADPVAAFSNIARALEPGARLVQLVWQDESYQEWVAAIRDALADGRERAGGPDPFSLADPATASQVLTAAGFTDVQVADVREPVYYGRDAEAACDAVQSLWMAQGLLAELDPAQAGQAVQRLISAFATRQTTDGVWLDSRAWIITAHRQ